MMVIPADDHSLSKNRDGGLLDHHRGFFHCKVEFFVKKSAHQSPKIPIFEEIYHLDEDFH
jgi:hypothetical protein